MKVLTAVVAVVIVAFWVQRLIGSNDEAEITDALETAATSEEPDTATSC